MNILFKRGLKAAWLLQSKNAKKFSENLSSVEFSEASNFDKIPSCVKSVHHTVTEGSHITLCYGV